MASILSKGEIKFCQSRLTLQNQDAEEEEKEEAEEEEDDKKM
jgi:hypothetical protein